MQYDPAKNFTRDEIIARGRALWIKDGKPISFRRFCRLACVPPKLVRQMFGGWRRLRRLIDPQRQSRPARKNRRLRQLVELLKCFDKEKTERITQREFCALAGITPCEIIRRFGSWRQFREAAGMSRRSRPRRLFTNRELLDELLYFYIRSGRRPEKRLVEERGGKHRVIRLLNRFGTWRMVELYFDAWLRMYFSKDDLNWTMTEHERTFVPDPNAKLEWPPDKSGLDWSSETGWVHPDKL